MDIRPYYLPETSTVNVEISPLLHGFIWKFRCIIAQAGILWLKLLYVRAERHTGGPRSLHARRLSAILQYLLAKTARELAERRPILACGAWAAHVPGQ
jgi:hypothetical protein